MRTIVLLFITITGLTTSLHAAGSDNPYARLINLTGLQQIVLDARADLNRAAKRHASRCNSTQFSNPLTAETLQKSIVERLEWKHTAEEAGQLVSWYATRVGKKAKNLEAQPISEEALKHYKPNPGRLEKIREIYQNTTVKTLIPQTAVEIEYSGWLLSGCLERAEASGDIKSQHNEMTRALGIKREAATLEEIFEEDSLKTMAYLLAPMSMEELTRYADATELHADLYSSLVSSIVTAVRAEVLR